MTLEWIECEGAGLRPNDSKGLVGKNGEGTCQECGQIRPVTYQTIVPHRVQRMTA